MPRCPLCDYENEQIVSLQIHHSRKHKRTAKQLYVDLFHHGVEPTCACGCGEIVRFWTIVLGFAKYKRGHVARVHNNWGHNNDALQKSQDVRRDQIAAGEWQAWNKGKTKETDEHVAAYGDKGHKTIMSNPDERKVRSERLTKGRLDGTVRTLFGKDHSQWKGGVSSVQALARSYVFNVWTYPKLHAANFTCQKCGAKHDLEVHHDKERFAEILQKARLEFGDVTDDFATHQAYARWITDYHVQNDVSGIVLCEDCHEKAHVAA